MDAWSPLELEFFARSCSPLAGVDEAGRGPLAGPVIAAAVLCDVTTLLPGVRDSKKLSPASRERLFDEISRRALAVGIGRAEVGDIDRLNILEASILAMHRALEALPLLPAHVLVDGNRFRHPHLPFTTVVKGDALCMSIAAASIIAKVTRDREMERLGHDYPGYGFEQHRGYPTRAHYEALEQLGPCPHHRLTFLHDRNPWRA